MLRRTMFGAKKSDVDYFASKSMSTVIDELISSASSSPNPPVNNYNNQRITDPDIAFGETWVNGPDNATLTGARLNSLRSWWIGQMLNQDRTIQEKMTLFWHNHFATEMNVYRNPIHGYDHCKLLRDSALGNFKTLVKAVTLDPAMLIYLNGQRNNKRAADENYARELQELFTLGKGPDSQYTESDVQQAAKILTGYRIDRATLKSYFEPSLHDTGDKTFSSFYGGKVITGQTGTDGAKELDELLDMIFVQEEVSKHICRKLYRWFVYYEIDSAAEENVIKPLATIFRANNYEIKPVLKALFSSEHFFDQVNRSCVIKSPTDHLIGFFRTTDIVFPDATNLETQYYYWLVIYQQMGIQQQAIGDPPNVAGWPAYYQTPQYHELWINSDTLPKRNQITDIMVYFGLRRGDVQLAIDILNFADSFNKPESPGDLVNEWVEFFYPIAVGDSQKEDMKDLLTLTLADSYWTDAWNNYKADPTDTTKANVVSTRLKTLLKHIMNLAEFQLS